MSAPQDNFGVSTMSSASDGRYFLGTPLLLTTLLGIYVIQSTIGMFTFQGLPAIFRAEGISTANIGLLSLIMLPWVLKFLWAPQVERYRKKNNTFNNHIKISTIGNTILAVSLLSLMLFPLHKAWTILVGSLFFMALVSTVVDISGDGFAVDQLSQKNHSLGNIIQVGGAYIGVVIGGGLFIYLVDSMGWRTGLLVLAIAILIMALPTLFLYRHRPQQSSVTDDKNSDYRPSLINAWRNTALRKALFIVCIAQLGTRLVLSMMMPFLVDKGLALSDIGLLAAGGGAPAALVGVFFGGLLLRKVGTRFGLFIVCLLEASCFVVFLLSASIPELFGDLTMPIILLFIVVSLVTAAKFVAICTFMMDKAKGLQSGVDFTLLQSADALMAVIAGVLGGLIIAQWGYPAHFTLAITFTLAYLLLFINSAFH